VCWIRRALIAGDCGDGEMSNHFIAWAHGGHRLIYASLYSAYYIHIRHLKSGRVNIGVYAY